MQTNKLNENIIKDVFHDFLKTQKRKMFRSNLYVLFLLILCIVNMLYSIYMHSVGSSNFLYFSLVGSIITIVYYYNYSDPQSITRSFLISIVSRELQNIESIGLTSFDIEKELKINYSQRRILLVEKLFEDTRITDDKRNINRFFPVVEEEFFISIDKITAKDKNN